VLDHYRAVAVAIANKVRAGFGAQAGDRLGGSTFTFTVHDAHPHASEVYALLRETRVRAQALRAPSSATVTASGAASLSTDWAASVPFARSPACLLL
jgi:hypothetical protein